MNGTDDRPSTANSRLKPSVPTWNLAGSVDQQSVQLARIIAQQHSNIEVFNRLLEEKARLRRRRYVLYISGILFSVLALIVVLAIWVLYFGAPSSGTREFTVAFTVLAAVVSGLVAMYSSWSFRRSIQVDKRAEKYFSKGYGLKVVRDDEDGTFYILNNKDIDEFEQ